MIDLEKERGLFEIKSLPNFKNVTFEINPIYEQGYYKENSSHHEDLDDSYALSKAWFSWVERAELADAEEFNYKSMNGELIGKLHALQQKLAQEQVKQNMWRDEKNHAIKRWHDIAQECEELKQKLARYENPDYVLVPRVPSDEMLNALYDALEVYYDDWSFNADLAYKGLIEAVENDDESNN